MAYKYILISLFIIHINAYICPEDKLLDIQLRTCIKKDFYHTYNETNTKHLNIGYDLLLNEFTEEKYYYKINDKISTCPKNYFFNGITCKLTEEIIANQPKNVVCNIKYISSIDYKNLPTDICNSFIFGPFDLNDQYEITYVNFWENSTKLNEVIKYSTGLVNTEVVKGIYISMGRNPDFWKNILENKDIETIKNKLEEFVKEYNISGLVLRYVNTTKFSELVDKLSVPFMLNINTVELVNTPELKHIIEKSKYVNILLNKEKSTNNTIIPLYEQKDLENTIESLLKLNIDKNKINIGYPLYGKKYEISDENAKLIYKNRNITEIRSEKSIKMFEGDNNFIPINSICNKDARVCTKEDINGEIPDCIYTISDTTFGNWLIYKNKLTNFIDSNTFYKMNDIRQKNGIMGVFIDSLDDDFGIHCEKDYPAYYFTNAIARVTHVKSYDNIIHKINTHTKSYFINKEKNTSETPCLNEPCTKTGFMEYKCNVEKYIKCVKIKNIFYKYIFSCRKGFRFNNTTKKCRKVKK